MSAEQILERIRDTYTDLAAGRITVSEAVAIGMSLADGLNPYEEV